MLCDTSGTSCVTVKTITFSGIKFTFLETVKNERKSDSILRVDINHNCCAQSRGVKFYPNTETLYPFKDYLKCGNDVNTIHYDRIDLSKQYCSVRVFGGPFGKK
uniref:CUB domain-containing protein n=1 Tax=Parastrongyloides trichosuri TaxID=131310 RepID=A0A0N4ZJU8_PARTI